MLKNKVRKVMYGSIIIMIALMSAKKVEQAINLVMPLENIEDVHTSLV